MRSDNETIKKKAKPKIKPKVKPKKLGLSRKIVRSPLGTHNAKSQIIIFLWDGSVNRDE
jgi:hypothetical protein